MQVLDREIGIDLGNDDVAVHGCEGTIDDQNRPIVDARIDH